MPEDRFHVSVDEPSPGWVVVGVAGEIDVATAPELERALADAGAEKRVVLDLSECQFIDSSGLRTLLGARSAASRPAAHLRSSWPTRACCVSSRSSASAPSSNARHGQPSTISITQSRIRERGSATEEKDLPYFRISP